MSPDEQDKEKYKAEKKRMKAEMSKEDYKLEKKRLKAELKAKKAEKATTPAEKRTTPTGADRPTSPSVPAEKPWYKNPEWVRAIVATASLIVAIVTLYFIVR